MIRSRPVHRGTFLIISGWQLYMTLMMYNQSSSTDYPIPRATSVVTTAFCLNLFQINITRLSLCYLRGNIRT